MAKFFGTLKGLKNMMAAIGVEGRWVSRPEYQRYVTHDDAIMNWWPSTGTYNLQGPAEPRADLQRRVQKYLERRRGVLFASPPSSKRTR